MNVFKKLKIWRGIGRIIDTKIGASITDILRKPFNKIAAGGVSGINHDVAWTPFRKPLAESCVAIVSTGGFYLEGDEPFDVDNADGEANFRTIPSNFDKEKLKIAHTHYPHERVNEDINVLFPVERLKELVEAKVIGKLSPNFYSFGFSGRLTEELIGKPNGSAHLLAQKLKADGVDYMLMVPA